jgi:alcohol dehydrogenase (NADP+)
MSYSEASERQIDANLIPKLTLYTGSKIPCVGLGTFGSDSVPAETVAETVGKAIRAGYRHVDCASVYGNEREIGNVLEYLDLYLVHWPFPNYHPPQCDVSSRSPNAKPYLHENYMKTWRAMEKLVDEGLVRNIGTSNMTIPKLKLLLRDAKIKPACNEMELHPHFQQTELFNFCLENEIQPIGYCPLGSPGRPERDRTPTDTVDLDDNVILGIAERLEATPAQVAIQWAIQRGQIPIPFSVNHYFENLEAAVKVKLTEGDMRDISRIDKNSRLIKGQVFLWKENQSWEDLWDPGGKITAG